MKFRFPTNIVCDFCLKSFPGEVFVMTDGFWNDKMRFDRASVDDKNAGEFNGSHQFVCSECKKEHVDSPEEP